MFGYVTIDRPEMKIREYYQYKGYYCGLCHELRDVYGVRGQMTLTYDMTFVVILLSSLYEPETKEWKKRCLIHPAKKQFMLTNEVTDYASDMNILLTHDHFRDDWEDEKKLSAFLGMKVFARKKKRMIKKYPRQAEAVERALSELSERERENCRDIDAAARPFGNLMAELFVWREDPFQNILRQFGFYLGKFIYMMDACMDVEQDKKNNCYNPFLDEYGEDGFAEKIHRILEGTLHMAVAEFEKLPCEQDLAILRNILYEGVWTKYERKQNHDE